LIPYDLYYPRNSDNKTYYDQTGVILKDNGSLAAWYKFKNKRLNDEVQFSEIVFPTIYRFYKKSTRQLLKLCLDGLINCTLIRVSVQRLTDNEITTKTMKTWGPGNYPANYSLPGTGSYASGIYGYVDTKQ
jgi:hypothetical protein